MTPSTAVRDLGSLFLETLTLTPVCGLRYHGLSHIALASWGSYALHGANCRSMSFGLLSRHWFWRSLTLETPRWPAFRRFSWTACRRPWMQQVDLSGRQVAIIIRHRYSAAAPPALASCAAAHNLSCRHGVPVRPWTWTGLSCRRPSAGRKDSRSTTPAVIVDVGIGRPVYTTVHCRRPSVSRRRGTNMEQFASHSDVIKFPANIQN